MKQIKQNNYSKIRTAEDLIPSRVPICQHSTQIQMKTYKSQVFFRDIIPLAMKRPEPLASATIQNLTQRTGTISASDGVFHIQANPDDVIQISYVGMTTFVAKARELPQAIYLSEKAEELAEVVVTPPKKPNPKATKTEASLVNVNIKPDEIHAKNRMKKIFFYAGGSLLVLALIGGGIWATTKRKNKK